MDASCRLADAPIAIHFLRLETRSGAPVKDQAAALAADVTGAAAAAIDLGAAARREAGPDVRDALVLVGQGDLTLILVDADLRAVDPVTFASVSAVLGGSAAFTDDRPPPRALFPESALLEPGLPLRLRPGLRGAGRPDLAERALALAGRLPPEHALDEASRSQARSLSEATREASIVTAHDLRGLALLLAMPA
jgi:hypothetical protein